MEKIPQRHSVIEWLERAKAAGLPWADQAIENLNIQNPEGGVLPETTMAGALSGAFVWEDTTQEDLYWRTITGAIWDSPHNFDFGDE